MFVLPLFVLKRNDIGLWENADWYLDKFGPKKMAAFDRSGTIPTIILRKGATKAEVLHEIGHALAFKRLRKKLYESLDPKIRETIASAFATKPSFTDKMTLEQILFEFKNMKAEIPSDILELLKGIP